MRNKLIFASLMLMLYSGAASGQTASDIEKKYGKPVLAFPVSEHVWMTPEYAADNQLCRATLYHRRISPETNYLGTYMPMKEVLAAFNQLAPPATRGATTDDFGFTATSSSMAWTVFEYEKVRFSFWIGFQFGSLADMKDKGVPFGGRAPTKIAGTDEFIATNAVKPEIAVITWKERKCVGQ